MHAKTEEFERQSLQSRTAMIHVTRLDHLVLTVSDVTITCDYYQRVLGMKSIVFGEERRALTFGNQKINLHHEGHELNPCADRPTPGSADLCFLVDGPMEKVLGHLQSCGIEPVEGPVLRTGALGPMQSIYLRDPDLNLIELSIYP